MLSFILIRLVTIQEEKKVPTKRFTITKDEDFAARIQIRSDGPVIVWLRVENCSNRALLIWFAPLFPHILSRIEQGEKLIEII